MNIQASMATHYQSKSLLLWIPDVLRFRLLERSLAQLAPITRSVSRPDVSQLQSFSFVVVDLAGVKDTDFADFAAEVLRTRPGCRLVVLARGKSPETWRHLLAPGIVSNILASDSPIATQELFTTMRKLLGADIFGLDKYFPHGVTKLEWKVHRTDELAPTLAGVEKYLQGISVHQRLVSQMISVADEFLTNALYNAPVSPDGQRLFHKLSRGTPVELPQGRTIHLSMMCDGEVLGLSAVDEYGSLEADTVVSYLAKCFARGVDQIDQKPGGAGLGFYCVFEWLNHFIINIAAHQRTEMIGLMNVSGSYKTFLAANKSFNLFVYGS